MKGENVSLGLLYRTEVLQVEQKATGPSGNVVAMTTNERNRRSGSMMMWSVTTMTAILVDG